MKGKRHFTRTEAEQIRALLIERALADQAEQKSIRGKLRMLGYYISDFGNGVTARDFDYLVASGTITVENAEDDVIGNGFRPYEPAGALQQRAVSRSSDRDEDYVIDLCDDVLETAALRQHRFAFLRGDPGNSRVGACLPVDAYYPSLLLVVEYRERQHTESVRFFDRQQTISGVNKGEQRRIYDERRRQELPRQGITLVELSYMDFEHSRSKRLMRRKDDDMAVVRRTPCKWTRR